MIKVQNNLNVETGVSTLTTTREPIPAFLVGLKPESLADLSWTDPALGVQDCAWWPEVDQSPALNEYQRYGAETLTLGDGVVYSVKAVVPWTAEEIAADMQAKTNKLMQEVVSNTQKRLDDFAKTRNYDGILSLCTYATSSILQFQTEGQYGVSARDSTWSTLYNIMTQVQLGNRAMPSGFADIEAELPTLQWPN